MILKDKLIKEVEFSVRKNKPFANKPICLSFIGPVITSFLLFIMAITNNTHSKEWVHHLMLYTLGPIIIFSIFYIFKSKYTGLYGEVVFMLIPILIWILKPRINGETIKTLSIFAFSLAALGMATLIVAKLFKTNSINQQKPQEITIKYTTIILRFSFILISIMSIIALSILLSNWADLAMNFANATPIKPNGWKVDYNSASYISFVAIVTILIALSITSINLLESFLTNIKRYSRVHEVSENQPMPSQTKLINVMKTKEIQLTPRQALIKKRFANKMKKQEIFNIKERDNSNLTVEILNITKRKSIFNKKKNPWNR